MKILLLLMDQVRPPPPIRAPRGAGLVKLKIGKYMPIFGIKNMVPGAFSGGQAHCANRQHRIRPEIPPAQPFGIQWR